MGKSAIKNFSLDLFRPNEYDVLKNENKASQIKLNIKLTIYKHIIDGVQGQVKQKQ